MHREKNIPSGADEVNSIRDYFFCQQLIFLAWVSRSYVGKNRAQFSNSIVSELILYKNVSIHKLISAFWNRLRRE